MAPAILASDVAVDASITPITIKSNEKIFIRFLNSVDGILRKNNEL